MPIFSDIFKNDFRNLEISKHNIFWNVFGFSRINWSILGPPKIKINGLGAQGHVRKSRYHENDGSEGFPIMKSKSYESKVKQNNYTELPGYSFNNIYNRNESSDPLDTKTAFVHGFSGFPIGDRWFLFVWSLIILIRGLCEPQISWTRGFLNPPCSPRKRVPT